MFMEWYSNMVDYIEFMVVISNTRFVISDCCTIIIITISAIVLCGCIYLTLTAIGGNTMISNEYVWLKLSIQEREKLLKLLLGGQRVMAIKHVRTVTCLGLKPAKQFVDSVWLLEKVAASDPTRMSPKDEFKSEVLRVLTSALETINDPDMLASEKYQFLVDNHIPMLFSLCMEG